MECVKIFVEKLYVCLPKEHFLSAKKSVTFKELDGQSFLLANDLGTWNKVVEKHLPKSRFFKLEKESLEEIAKYSSIARFQTNVTMNFDEQEEKVRIPIEDEEATMPFYAIYRPKKKAVLEFVRLFR